MIPSPFFKPSFGAGLFPDASLVLGPAFFALFSSGLVGAILNKRKRLSAVNAGRTRRGLAAMSSATFGIESSGGGAGGRYPLGARHSAPLVRLRTTISLSPSCAMYA